tara:strand:- start:30 stop:428 length:399 start_codon:yes stop_codon:yes gene_type:complete
MTSFGTLKADTLTHSTAGSLATNFVVNGSAKAWAYYQQHASNAINASLNVSSMTDNAAGDATITYTNSMSGAGLYAVTTSGANGHVLTDDAGRDDAATAKTLAASQRLQHQSVGGTDQDGNQNSMSVLGDLA